MSEQAALDHAVLGQVALGYSPMIDRQRAVVATRVTVYPQVPDSTPDAKALVDALLEVWPAPVESVGELKLTLRPLDPKATAQRAGTPAAAGGSTMNHPVSLNVASESMLGALMQAAPPPHLMVEVPAFMASDAQNFDALRRLRDAGSVLLIKGRPISPLAPEVLACFSHSIVEAADDRRGSTPPAPGVRQVSTVQSGTRSAADIEAAFSRGAVAVLGWPLDDALPKSTGRVVVPADIQLVMELINAVEREEPVAKLEGILKRDPTLAFRLLRYLNSPGFGLSAEVTGFGHAIMMLGYARMKRWLALLLASSSKGVNARPLMHAALRRGLLMEELVRGNSDTEMRGEMFICGVFSLLDRMLQQPLAELLKGVPVPERVQQTLLGESGPYTPYLDLVRATEQEAVFEIRECTERLLLSPVDVNRAVLLALRGARQLDG
jgi:c-di-GMP phosphodiesterase